MAKRENTLTPTVISLIDQLSELGYSSFVHHRMSYKQITEYRKYIEEAKGLKKSEAEYFFGASSRLAVPILTGKFKHHYPHPGYSASNEKHLDVLEELDLRLQSQLLALAFEATEEFFKQITSQLLFLCRSAGKPKIPVQKNAFGPFRPKKVEIGTPAYFDAYVKWYARRNCDSLLQDLCTGFPQFRTVGESNILRTDLFVLFSVVGFCRHRVVHKGGAVRLVDVKKLPFGWPQLMEEEVLRTSVITGKLTICPKMEFLSGVQQKLSAFAVLLYYLASDELNFKIDLPIEAKPLS